MRNQQCSRIWKGERSAKGNEITRTQIRWPSHTHSEVLSYRVPDHSEQERFDQIDEELANVPQDYFKDRSQARGIHPNGPPNAHKIGRHNATRLRVMHVGQHKHSKGHSLHRPNSSNSTSFSKWSWTVLLKTVLNFLLWSPSWSTHTFRVTWDGLACTISCTQDTP